MLEKNGNENYENQINWHGGMPQNCTKEFTDRELKVKFSQIWEINYTQRKRMVMVFDGAFHHLW